jgi:hypothetical protein
VCGCILLSLASHLLSSSSLSDSDTKRETSEERSSFWRLAVVYADREEEREERGNLMRERRRG